MGVINEQGKRYTVPNTTPAVVKLEAPIRGFIRRFRVTVLTGTPGAATMALYNSNRAFTVDGSGQMTATLASESEQYRVTPDMGLPAPGDGFGLNYGYSNRDGGLASTTQRFLYLATTGLAGCQILVNLAVEDPSHL